MVPHQDGAARAMTLEVKFVVDKLNELKEMRSKITEFEDLLKRESGALSSETALELKRYAAIWIQRVPETMGLAVDNLTSVNGAAAAEPVKTMALAMKGHYAELNQALRTNDRTGALRELEEINETLEAFLKAPAFGALVLQMSP